METQTHNKQYDWTNTEVKQTDKGWSVTHNSQIQDGVTGRVEFYSAANVEGCEIDLSADPFEYHPGYDFQTNLQVREINCMSRTLCCGQIVR